MDKKILEAVQPYTMLDRFRLESLSSLAEQVVRENVPGDFVECGVCNGGSAAVLAAGLTGSPEKKMWLYDTFEGIPAPGPRDPQEAAALAGQMKGDIRKVREIFSKTNFPEDRLRIMKGEFAETFRSLPSQAALVHIDADWYESVLLCLRTFYPLVPDGGMIILDDFGWWEGTRRAFYDFCAEQRTAPLLERCGRLTQAYWIKGREHCRGTEKA